VTERRKLVDILQQADARENLRRAWQDTAAAAEFAPLPPGEYTFRIVSGELFTSKSKGTPGYKLTLQVTEGEHEGRRAWCDFWLTPAALPMTKRDLHKIGVRDLDQLEHPLPPGILIRGKLALRTGDDANESNRLTRFDCIGVEPADAFAPQDANAAGEEESRQTANDLPSHRNDNAEELFPFAANVGAEGGPYREGR
jgi:hypothetical protein